MTDVRLYLLGRGGPGLSATMNPSRKSRTPSRSNPYAARQSLPLAAGTITDLCGCMPERHALPG